MNNHKQILNHKLSYTKSWQKTLWTAGMLGFLIAFILIFLQPRYSYLSTSLPYKKLKLAGFAFTLIIPIILVHFVENIWYQKSKKQRLLYQEIVILLLGFILMIITSYLYNILFIPQIQAHWLGWPGFYRYITYICLPYFPVVLPLWYYLRRQWGTIYQEVAKEVEEEIPQKIQIVGNNKNEVLVIYFKDLVYAQVQQNYVEVFFLDDTNEVQSKMLRLTFAELLKQVPQILQIHRSFAVNMTFYDELRGSSRKRFLKLKNVKINLPVSQKYYPNIENQLVKSSQKLQK